MHSVTMETLTIQSRLQYALARIWKSSFVRNCMVIVSATAVAQAVAFALSPVMSRLYSPSDFGVFGSFNAVLGVITSAVTFEYLQAIQLPKDKEDAANLFVLSCGCSVIVAIVCLGGCLIVPGFLNGLMKASGSWMLLMLVVGVLLSGLSQSFQAWCIRVKAFKQTSASQVSRSLSSNGAIIGFGYLNAGSWALVFCSSVLGELVAASNLARVAVRDLRMLRPSIRWERVVHLAKEYRDFPIYTGTMSIMNALSQGLPILLLTHYYGIAVAGSYAFGMRILQTPLGLILSAVRQVLFQKASEANYEGNPLFPLYLKITVGLLGLILIPSLIIVIWAPPLFVWLFGDKWTFAGQLARILILWLMFYFCNVPSVLFARIVRFQKQLFVTDVILLIGRGATLIVGGRYLTATWTVALFCAFGAIMNIVFIVIIGYVLRKKDVDPNWRSRNSCGAVP